MQINAVSNIPVLLNGDHTKILGRANVYPDGSMSMVFSGPLGETFQKEFLSVDLKSLSLGYEYLKATPVEAPRETTMHCVDGVDGFTPDMLRVRKPRMITCICGEKHADTDINFTTTCVCGEGLFFRAVGQRASEMLEDIIISIKGRTNEQPVRSENLQT